MVKFNINILDKHTDKWKYSLMLGGDPSFLEYIISNSCKLGKHHLFIFNYHKKWDVTVESDEGGWFDHGMGKVYYNMYDMRVKIEDIVRTRHKCL